MNVRAAADFVKHARILRNTREYLTYIPDYFRSRGPSLRYRETFDGVHTYCMFIGVGRSGTTLVGALLDAHPNIILAHQQNTLKYVRPGLFERRQIYYLLLQNSQNAARTGRMGNGGYAYAVAGQWQGRFTELKVIGDKSMSGQAVTWLSTTPRILDSLHKITKARIRMIHVIRNPYDTITTRAYRRKLPIAKIADEYFSLYEKLAGLVRASEAIDAFDVARIPVYLEDLIENPHAQLASICGQLGVRANREYLESCTGIIYKKPRKTRYSCDWAPDLIDRVKRDIDRFPCLARYSFDH